MGYKVFVTYKYGDTLVSNLNKSDFKVIGGQFKLVPRATRARDYVDELQKKIGKDHMNLGEKDGESLEEFKNSTIETALKKKIFQSSVTIVIISKGMKETGKSEGDQWIPWEVSYSLREVTREDRTSQMNAILGVVLPDENDNYNWYYESHPECNCTTHLTGQLFKILSRNMFNIKNKTFRECNGISIHTTDESSFIKTVKWGTFMEGNNYNYYIEKAIEIKGKEQLYDIEINLD
jgi:hypothetical protein